MNWSLNDCSSPNDIRFSLEEVDYLTITGLNGLCCVQAKRKSVWDSWTFLHAHFWAVLSKFMVQTKKACIVFGKYKIIFTKKQNFGCSELNQQFHKTQMDGKILI